MNQAGTIDDAAVVFSALSGDQVIALLSRLETNDAQRLLATAAKAKPDAHDLARANTLLNEELLEGSGSHSNRQNEDRDEREQMVERPEGLGFENSLDFLIEWSDQHIRLLLSNVSTACWAPALKSESKGVREIVFRNVAPAIKHILNQELAAFDGNSIAAQTSREKIISAASELQRSATQATRSSAA